MRRRRSYFFSFMRCADNYLFCKSPFFAWRQPFNIQGFFVRLGNRSAHRHESLIAVGGWIIPILFCPFLVSLYMLNITESKTYLKASKLWNSFRKPSRKENCLNFLAGLNQLVYRNLGIRTEGERERAFYSAIKGKSMLIQQFSFLTHCEGTNSDRTTFSHHFPSNNFKKTWELKRAKRHRNSQVFAREKGIVFLPVGLKKYGKAE